MMKTTTNHRAVDASELGLRPGVWPMYLGSYTKGRSITDREGELLYVIYIDPVAQLILHVYND